MTEHQMREYYRERAEEYEEIYHRDDPGRQAELAAIGAKLEEAARGRRVLELACGSGYWTEVMARTAKSITAVDVEPAMLEVARKKKYPIPVEFVQADMFGSDFEPGGYGLVALGFWLSHQPKQDYERLYDVLIRPLSPDGLIWMIDNNPPAEGPQHYSVGQDEYGNNFKTRVLADGREFVILKNYFERDGLERLLGKRFGIEWLTFGHRYWSVILRPRR